MRKHGYAVNAWHMAHVQRCIDGDTLDVRILEHDRDPSDEIRVRIARMDAPELDGPQPGAAQASLLFLRELLKDRLCALRPTHAWTDPYGRVLADLWIASGDVATLMIVGGHAVKYLNLAQRNLRAARAALMQARARTAGSA